MDNTSGHRSSGMAFNNEVVVLKVGYATTNEKGQMRAGGTISLITGEKNILVDTGGPQDKAELLAGLKDHGVSCEDVDLVVGTHGHSDHIGNLNLFPDSTFIVSHDICKGDLYLDHTFNPDEPVASSYKISEYISVMATPGHTCSDVSVMVRNTKQGTIVIAGDIFECKEDLQDDSIWKQNSNNVKEQEKSRMFMLNIADYIIPGHGPMFKVEDSKS